MTQRNLDQAIDEKRTWQYRALAYCQGNKSNTGALIIAMLGRYTVGKGYHPGGLRILANGKIVGLARGTSAERWDTELVYNSVDELNAVFRGLAVALRLSDDDTNAMFTELRKFVFQDDRAVSYLPGVTNEDGSKVK